MVQSFGGYRTVANVGSIGTYVESSTLLVEAAPMNAEALEATLLVFTAICFWLLDRYVIGLNRL